MKKQFQGKIKTIKKIAKDTFEIKILSDLKNAIAGQFISILCPNTTLRRPFSISDFENGVITIIFKLKGEGTKYIQSLKEGDSVDFLAPLGNGFEIENKKTLLIGAGVGIAPMLFLKKEMDKKGIKNYLISGFKAQDEIISGSDENVVGGSVLDNIEKLIIKEKFEIIYSCAPTIVLKKISLIAKKLNLPCYLAMEKVMACSIGVCRGCVIRLVKNDDVVYASVCKDGPVFKGSELIWD